MASCTPPESFCSRSSACAGGPDGPSSATDFPTSKNTDPATAPASYSPTMTSISFALRSAQASSSLRRGTLTLTRRAVPGPTPVPTPAPITAKRRANPDAGNAGTHDPALAADPTGSHFISERERATSSLSTTIESPTLLISSRRLLVPHLTMDVLSTVLPHATIADVPVEASFRDLPSSTFPGALRSFANWGSQFTLWSARDVAVPFPATARHGKDFVQMRTDAGLIKVTGKDFMEAAARWRPDLVAVPAHVLNAKGLSSKAASRAVERTVAMLDECLAVHETLPNPPPVLATITGTSPTLLESCAQKVATHAADKVAGYVLDSPVADLTPAASALAPTAWRYAASCLTPDAMVRNLHVADAFPSALAYVLAGHGYALHVDWAQPEQCAVDHLADADRHRTSKAPLRDGCSCWACQRHNRAYVYHLLDCHEMLGWTLLTIHNLHQLDHFLAAIRTAIDTLPAADIEHQRAHFLATWDANIAPQITEILEAIWTDRGRSATPSLDHGSMPSLVMGKPTAGSVKLGTTAANGVVGEKETKKRPRSPVREAEGVEGERPAKRQEKE
ncbi:tRNA-guanine transglycosylase, various specificities [Allomyces macrogynus ATCC 38327]|uniref:tRNA-guanine transglycosylase, various specificities n=1 Tax=Allomyces macrogynus (strain ATCC 38327) TaxID=578462 RepID=A0A0L0T0B1_ALLM3|nr:tRNA-guanine transglycosylase, various specificities [Allomyces macrogynus ATCC 38327]|eukprot:KNE68085.1 tRNA-guanine transglycosylase, various specificities [Allomyces macrogynus ATCC 38327]